MKASVSKSTVFTRHWVATRPVFSHRESRLFKTQPEALRWATQTPWAPKAAPAYDHPLDAEL